MFFPYNEWNTTLSKVIQFNPGDIHIWGTNLLLNSIQLQELYNALSEDERHRALQYRFKNDRRCFIACRAMLRKILSIYGAIEPQNIKFAYNSYGKPCLKEKFEKTNLQFNLSHSGDVALYIIANGQKVGIDIEKVYPINDYVQIAKQFFSVQEYLNLKSISLTEQLGSFFKCWTRKEAFIKAIGNGLSFPLQEFEVSLAPSEPVRLLNVKGDPSLASKWSLHSLLPSVGYEAAYVIEGTHKSPQFWRYAP